MTTARTYYGNPLLLELEGGWRPDYSGQDEDRHLYLFADEGKAAIGLERNEYHAEGDLLSCVYLTLNKPQCEDLVLALALIHSPKDPESWLIGIAGTHANSATNDTQSDIEASFFSSGKPPPSSRPKPEPMAILSQRLPLSSRIADIIGRIAYRTVQATAICILGIIAVGLAFLFYDTTLSHLSLTWKQ